MAKLEDFTITSLLPVATGRVVLPENVSRAEYDTRFGSLDSQRERDIYRMTTACQAAIENLHYDRNWPGFEGASYGFIPVGENTVIPNGIASSNGYVFGAAIKILPRGEAAQFVEIVEYGNLQFAVVFNAMRSILHVANPTYPTGTGACWAKSLRSAIKPASDGVLTAAHNVKGVHLTGSVSMSDPGSWYLGDRRTCKIDAALVVKAGCIPGSASRLTVRDYPLATQSFTFTGVGSGGTITGKIQHSVPNPTSFNEAHPLRLYLETFGVHGDSGALVTDSSSGEGLGIYIGSLANPGSGVVSGIAQLLSQAEHALNIECYL